MQSNVTEDICYAQPKSLAQRLAIGNDFIRRYHFPLPFAVDGIDNAADLAHAAWPERIYIIDEHGLIVYRGDLGPFGYHPEEARAWLAARFGPQLKPPRIAKRLTPMALPNISIISRNAVPHPPGGR